jgi:hypothetical protein
MEVEALDWWAWFLKLFIVVEAMFLGTIYTYSFFCFFWVDYYVDWFLIFLHE